MFTGGGKSRVGSGSRSRFTRALYFSPLLAGVRREERLEERLGWRGVWGKYMLRDEVFPSPYRNSHLRNLTYRFGPADRCVGNGGCTRDGLYSRKGETLGELE
jgi:hypothetical protein